MPMYVYIKSNNYNDYLYNLQKTFVYGSASPHEDILRSKYRTWPYLAKGKGEIQRMFLWAYLLIIASGFKAGELIWPSVVLSRALLG